MERESEVGHLFELYWDATSSADRELEMPTPNARSSPIAFQELPIAASRSIRILP